MRGNVEELPRPSLLGLKSNSMAQMAFFGTGCIINEQVILQDQEGFRKAA
jgi:hypothetical protein